MLLALVSSYEYLYDGRMNKNPIEIKMKTIISIVLVLTALLVTPVSAQGNNALFSAEIELLADQAEAKK